MYLNDFIMLATAFEEHLEKLKTVLQRLREHGTMLPTKKYSFCQRRGKYLDIIVTADRIEAHGEDNQMEDSMPGTRTTIHRLHQILPEV